MLSAKNSVMLKEAKLARRKPAFIFQILIFIAVLLTVQLAADFIISIPAMISMFTGSGHIQAAASGDLSAIQTLMVEGLQTPNRLVIVSLFAAGAGIPLAIIYCKHIEGRSLRSMGFIKRGWLARYTLGYALGAVMLLSAAGIACAFGTISFTLSKNIQVFYILAFFLGYLVQGMAEEVITRGYFMVSLSNRAHIAIAVGISSAAFSLMHLKNDGVTPLCIFNLALFGVLMALYILRSDDILGACALHSAWNFFQGNILGIKVSGINPSASLLVGRSTPEGFLMNGGPFGLEGGLAVTAVLATAILLMLFLPQRRP